MDAGLLKTLKNVKLTSHKRRCTDNDFVDRFNCFYTPLIITIFTIVICTKSYIVGTPLQCWVPVEFSTGWEKFAESYCYIKNTYYIPVSSEIPNSDHARKKAELQYYQWVPFVLGLQSMLFFIPSLFWKVTNWKGNLHIQPLVEKSVVSSYESGDTKITTLESVAEHINSCLFKRNGRVEQKKFFQFNNSGSYLTICYMMTKILYIVNILMQFLIVQSFLKVDFSFGLQLIHKLVNGSDWQETGIFPRVTLCDFPTHQMGQPISYTLQCVLVINLFNEKIYIFLWFWFLFLLIITVASLFMWIFQMQFQNKLTYFFPRKSDYGINGKRIEDLLSCQNEMTTDAYFVLRIIEGNCGNFITRKIVENLINLCNPNTKKVKDESLPPTYQEQDEEDNNLNLQHD